MLRYSAVALLVLLESVGGFLLSENRHVVAAIKVDNGGPFGVWHQAEYCPSSMYAVGYAIKVEQPQGSGDDTALNGITLICRNRNGTVSGGSVASGTGPFGAWNDPMYCFQGQVMVQFVLKVELPLGSDGDDTSANDVMFRCDSFETRTGAASDLHAEGGTGWGDWSPARSNACPNRSAICGLQTSVELYLGKGRDDTSLNDVKFLCCDD